MTTVVFVRHAQSAPSAELPEADWPLSEKGQAQAQALVPVLGALGVDALVSSPFLRTRETLRPFAETSGLSLRVDEDLRERKLTGGWLPDIAAVEAAVRRMFAEPAFAFPGGESALACIARFEKAVGRVVAAHPDRVVAVASHGGVLSHFMAGHHGGPPFDFWRAMLTPHIFVFDCSGPPRWIGEQTLE